MDEINKAEEYLEKKASFLGGTFFNEPNELIINLVNALKKQQLTINILCNSLDEAGERLEDCDETLSSNAGCAPNGDNRKYCELAKQYK